jgi:hypothetical protein
MIDRNPGHARQEFAATRRRSVAIVARLLLPRADVDVNIGKFLPTAY